MVKFHKVKAHTRKLKSGEKTKVKEHTRGYRTDISKAKKDISKWRDTSPIKKMRIEEESKISVNPEGFKTFDMISGGLADNMSDNNFDSEQLAIGIQIELEHTDDIDLAKEIAKDHLIEHKNYYKELVKMEKKLDKIK